MSSGASPALRPHVVYVLRDKNERAIYAGYTSNLARRSAQHLADPRFSHLINRIEVDSEHPDRVRAQAREKDVIWDLEPPFNIKDNPAPMREQMARGIIALVFGEDVADKLEPGLDAKVRAVLEHVGDDALGASESLFVRNYLVVYRDCCKPLGYVLEMSS